MVLEKFQIYSVKIAANMSQKIESARFNSCPQAKLSPRCLSLSPRQRGGEDYVVEKITKINKGIGHKFL